MLRANFPGRKQARRERALKGLPKEEAERLKAKFVPEPSGIKTKKRRTGKRTGAL